MNLIKEAILSSRTIISNCAGASFIETIKGSDIYFLDRDFGRFDTQALCTRKTGLVFSYSGKDDGRLSHTPSILRNGVPLILQLDPQSHS